MIVKELIEKLNKLPQDAVVYSCWDNINKADMLLLDAHEGFPTPPDYEGTDSCDFIDINYNKPSVLLVVKDYSTLISDEKWKSPGNPDNKFLHEMEDEEGEEYLNGVIERNKVRQHVLPAETQPWPTLASQILSYKNIFENVNDSLGKSIALYLLKNNKLIVDDVKIASKNIEENLDGTCLTVEDLSEQFLPLLSEDLRNSIQNKVDKQISFDYICKYHSLMIKKEEKEKGIKKLAEDIENVSKSVKIVGCLAPCSSLKLAVVTETDAIEMPEALFIFIAVKLEDSDEYDRLFHNKLISSIQEGEMGNTIE